MRLAEFLAGVFRASEEAYQHFRDAYTADLERMEDTATHLPGQPPMMAATELSTLAPKRMRLKTFARLRDGLEVSLSGCRGRRVEIEIEWESSEPPEAVMRIKDTQDNITEIKAKEQLYGRRGE